MKKNINNRDKLGKKRDTTFEQELSEEKTTQDELKITNQSELKVN